MINNMNINTKVIGNKIIYFEEMESTQIMAKELAEKNIENGTIIITDNQTKGIGTHDRKWLTSKGKNLTFSIIIYPKCSIKKLETLTIDIANIIIDSIYQIYNVNLKIKEPNDIVFNEKKMGGILTQATSKGNKVKYLVIGIGFNVNQTKFNDEIKDSATSMKKEFGKEFDREEILKKFSKEFEDYLMEEEII